MDYIIYFAITIGILVFIHELGHFLAAKMILYFHWAAMLKLQEWLMKVSILNLLTKNHSRTSSGQKISGKKLL